MLRNVLRNHKGALGKKKKEKDLKMHRLPNTKKNYEEEKNEGHGGMVAFLTSECWGQPSYLLKF